MKKSLIIVFGFIFCISDINAQELYTQHIVKPFDKDTYGQLIISHPEYGNTIMQQYASMRKSPNNNHIMKAKMAEFMEGLESRYKSRIHLLDKAQRKNEDRAKGDFEC